VHIIDLQQTAVLFRRAYNFIRNVAADGSPVLFVGTKKQAAPIVKLEAQRAGQFYVNSRWLGGMLTNWKTVKKSLERYKELLEQVADEQKRSELSKKELAAATRQIEKYGKSLEGMREMSRLPDVLFVIDVGCEGIAISEARRLGIPIVAIVDSNCSPEGIDFAIPGNDDSIRAISLYCTAIANASLEGAAIHQEKLRSQPSEAPSTERAGAHQPVRRVVEIKQPPRRGRGRGPGGGGGGGRRGEREGGGEEAAVQQSEGESVSQES
jgi:small subunit ribosomal protein S2